MWIHRRRPLDPVGGKETPEKVFLSRRRLLQAAGLGSGLIAASAAAGYFAWRRWRGSDAAVMAAGRVDESMPAMLAQAPRDKRFRYGRPETPEPAAARYTNFYEFSVFKWTWKYVGSFRPRPWQLTIGGLCRQPMRLDIDELLHRFGRHLVERQYRHRCVETWAMCVPWIGIPLAEVVRAADPLPQATHVRFQTFYRPKQAPGFLKWPDFPWPYTEGLTLAEATNPLPLLAVGMYGHALLKQHGAPVRLVVPWKYGYKSIKSIQRIDFLPHQPATFWNTAAPSMYPFESNVDPNVPRPWPQHTEHVLGSGTRYATELYNGYGQYVSHLYRKR